ncbi:MAG: hypothetical protein GYB53_17555 [Rhodobacteraceae bacterium]|nr:hypothetical protein [Paracoccaceae bacterium]MBR9823692.1 hypothetical protein [Paracoccaceae bacterium]
MTKLTDAEAGDLRQRLQLIVLRYDRIMAETETLVLDLRMDGRDDEADLAQARMTEMTALFRDAFRAVNDRLIAPSALAATRRELETGRRKAKRFVAKLEKTRLTLDRLQEAFAVLRASVATLTAALG